MLKQSTSQAFYYRYHSPSQTFNVAATIAVTVATAGLTSGIAASGVLGNTSAIMFGSMVGSGTNYVTSGGKSDLTVSFVAASFNFSNNELGYLGKDGNSTWQNVGYGLGGFGNVVDLFGVINPQNSFHTLQTDNTDLKNGFDPGHSQFENQNGKLSISFGPKNQRQNIVKKFLGSKGTNDYRSLHGMDINTELYNVGLNSKVVNTVNKISAKTPYSAALGIQCTGATTLTALLSGHFMPNIGLLTLNAPQFAHYTLMYERQIRTVSAFSSIYFTK
jgi:hypothetical protein